LSANLKTKKTKKVILKKKPVVTSQSKIDAMIVKLRTFIKVKLDMYYNTLKNEKNYKHISAEMSFPQEALKYYDKYLFAISLCSPVIIN